MDTEAQRDKRLVARTKMLEALHEYYESDDELEPVMITGFVGIAEIEGVDGLGIFWLCGNGMVPSEEQPAGLREWRIEGMLRHVLRTMLVTDDDAIRGD